MYRFLTIVAVTGLICLTAGCSQASRTPEGGPANLTLADSGKTLAVAPGDVVQVTLESNITTGYSWKLVPLNTQVIEQTKQEYVARKRSRSGRADERYGLSSRGQSAKRHSAWNTFGHGRLMSLRPGRSRSR